MSIMAKACLWATAITTPTTRPSTTRSASASYATFEVSDVKAVKTGACTATVSAVVKNTSNVDAAETVQVYVAPGKADVARPKHELKGFKKVFLKAGESAEVSFDLDDRAFAYWSEKFNDWHVESGEYAIEVGTSSRDIAGSAVVELDGDGKTQPLTEWSNFMEWRRDPLGSKGARSCVPKVKPAACRSCPTMT